MSDRKTAVGYIRVSTDEQAREGYSLENQKAEIERKCKYESWDLLKVFDDKGISGALLDQRDGLKAMLRFIKEHRVDYLVIYKLSRLSRKVADVVNIAEFLKGNETHLLAIGDGIDTSNPMGKYFLYLASIIADMERENIIVQVKGGMSQKAREGLWNGGKPPLGYDLLDKKLVVNNEEAETVKLIFSEYLKGNGYKTIAALLNERTIKTKTGSTFNGVGVKDILKNPTYIGKIRWGVRKDWGKLHEDNKRKRKYNDDPIISDGIHEPIIDEVVFNKVQELIEGNPRRNMKRFNGNHLLSGLLRCPVCNYGMSYQPAARKGKTYGYYICNQYMNHKTCKPNGVRKDHIEEEFLTIFEKIINEPEFKETMKSALNNSSEQVKELDKSIERKGNEIKKFKLDQDKYVQELIRGSEAFKEVMRTNIEKTINEISRLETDIMNLESEKRGLQDQQLDLDEVFELLEKAGKIIPLLEKEAQQSLVRKLISKIEIKDKHILEVHFSFQQSFRIGGGKGNRIISRAKFFGDTRVLGKALSQT